MSHFSAPQQISLLTFAAHKKACQPSRFALTMGKKKNSCNDSQGIVIIRSQENEDVAHELAKAAYPS